MEELDPQKTQFKALVDQHLLPVFQQRIDHVLAFLEMVRELQDKFVNETNGREAKTAGWTGVQKYKQELKKLIEVNFPKDNPGGFDTQFAAFSEAANQYLGSLDQWIVRIQDQVRFENQPEDSRIIRIGKGFKRVFFFLSKLPERIGNGFTKTKKPLKPWMHRIALTQLARFYLMEQLSRQMVPLLVRINQSICMALVLPKQIDKAINGVVIAIQEGEEDPPSISPMMDQLGQSIATLTEEAENLKEEAQNAFEEEFTAFYQAFFKAGTFELSNRRFRKSRIGQMHKKINRQTSTLESEWANTRMVLMNDWQIDIDLYHLIFSVLKEYDSAWGFVRTKFEAPVLKKLDAIEKFFSESEEKIRLASDDSELQNTIREEQTLIQSSLMSEKLPATNDYILAQELPSRINTIELRIDEMVNGLATKTGLVKGMDFTQPKPTKASSINYLSPFELISFESRPQVLKVTQKVKASIFQQVNHLQNAIVDLGQICEFNLESALAAFDGENKGQDPQTIALEGIERTKERLKEVRSMVSDVNRIVEEDLFPALQKFNHNLTQFTDIDTILELRVRVVKAKALERSRLLRKKGIQSAKNFIPVALAFLKSYYQKGHELIRQIYQKYGITSPSEGISIELADFLTETQQAVSNLPFVYKRLFSTEPLTDDSFFLHRNRELQTLNRAYNNWMKGRFATTLVVGEKGFGATSLLNFFLQDLLTSCEVFRFSADQALYTKEALYHFLNTQFDQDLGTQEEWVAYLNSGKKKIVILEDIHRLFIRKVNGFEALRELTQLMTHCEMNTFWVVSCTEYAYKYLDKTLLLSEQFNYLISLDVFDDQSIMKMIRERHKVSGYKIKYAMAPQDLNNKKLKKLTEEEQQALLEKEYFNYLNKIAKGNIFLMLTYWVRSVEEITDGTIFITSLKRYDLSFLRSVSTERVFALCALALHEQLSEEDYGLALNINPNKARRILNPMLEDGILILQDGQYSINPLLYRQTISLLKSKNLIY